jgi:hypothetical protein
MKKSKIAPPENVFASVEKDPLRKVEEDEGVPYSLHSQVVVAAGGFGTPS